MQASFIIIWNIVNLVGALFKWSLFSPSCFLWRIIIDSLLFVAALGCFIGLSVWTDDQDERTVLNVIYMGQLIASAYVPPTSQMSHLRC